MVSVFLLLIITDELFLLYKMILKFRSNIVPAPRSLRPPEIPKSLPHSHFDHQKLLRVCATLTSSTKTPEAPAPLSTRPPKIPMSLFHCHFAHEISRRTCYTLTSSTKNSQEPAPLSRRPTKIPKYQHHSRFVQQKIPKSLPLSHFVHHKFRRTSCTLTSSTKNSEEPSPFSF